MLLLAAVTGSYCIGTPFSASFRECQTAMITRNLWHDGWSGLFLPRIDWWGNQPGYMLLEFPLYNALVAWLYAIGGDHAWLGQMFSLICSLGSVALLFGIVRRLDNERVALAAAAIMALTPLQQFIGQAYLPEPLLILLSLASLYAMLRHVEGGGVKWLVLAAAGVAGAMLVKAPAGLALLAPLAFLAWTRDGWGVWRRPAFWLAAAFALGIYTLWQKHADHVNAQFYPYFLSTGPDQIHWNFGPLAMRWDWHFYVRIGGRLFVYLSPIVVVAALVGLFRRPAERRGWLIHVWLVANAGYALLCANLHFNHKHYQIVFVPVFAALAGRALTVAWERKRNLTMAVLVLLLCYDAALGLKLWREQRDPLIERASAAQREASRPADLVLVAAFTGRYGHAGNHSNEPNWLYFAQRRGWNAQLYDQFGIGNIEEHRQKGARWLLLTTEDEKLTRLANELASRYARVRAGDGFAVFDLRGK